MNKELETLFRHRQLIATLTARDLKARYRGSLLGFFWSLANPLLLLAVYTLVFTKFFPRGNSALDPYSLFLFTGILPWTFFAGSLLEATNSISSNAGLVKKVLFPAEALPLVVVFSYLAHFLFALPILMLAMMISAFMLKTTITMSVLFFPLILILQTALIAGLALIVSSASVLFRDLRDIIANVLQLAFFVTPILYLDSEINSRVLRATLRLNPMTPFILSYQNIFFFGRPPLLIDIVLMLFYSIASLFLGFIVFDRLRDTLAEAI